MNDTQEHLDRLRRAYGATDPETVGMFRGGFLNFGYWRHVELCEQPINAAQRAQASRALYALALDGLAPAPGHRVVEVGCGPGNGCRMAVERCPGLEVVGVDLIDEQVARARARHGESPGLSFCVGAAEALPLADGSVDRMLSVEAAQHFASHERFAAEAARALRPGGILVVTIFCATGQDAVPPLRTLLPSVAAGFDRPVPIARLDRLLAEAGFARRQIAGIGEHVWAPFDRWLSQTEYRDRWERGFLAAYRRGLLDYHVVRAVR